MKNLQPVGHSLNSNQQGIKRYLLHTCTHTLTSSPQTAKKNLAPSALAGLASKLDLTTVKLRKTGIVEHMLAEQAGEGGGVRPASPNPNTGTEHNTKHPVMLVQIKGQLAGVRGQKSEVTLATTLYATFLSFSI